MADYLTLTDPAEEPISNAEFKELAREASSDYDATVLPMHLAEAREHIIETTGRVAVNQTFRLTLDTFPLCGIVVERVPLVSVESIDYYDLADDPQTLVVGTDVRVVTSKTPGQIVLLPDKLWPATHADREVTIDFTAGYGADATGVPIRYKLAVAMYAKEKFRDWPEMSKVTRDAIDALRWRTSYVF